MTTRGTGHRGQCHEKADERRSSKLGRAHAPTSAHARGQTPRAGADVPGSLRSPGLRRHDMDELDLIATPAPGAFPTYAGRFLWVR